MKNFKSTLLIILLASLIVACGNTDTNSSNDIESQKPVEEKVDQTIDLEKSDPVEKEVGKNQAENNTEDDEKEAVEEENTDKEELSIEDENLITEDGQYYTAYNSQSDGGVNEYNLPEINSWKLEEDKLTVSGTLQNPYPDGEYTENKIHTFKLTDETSYTGVGADGEFEMDRENYTEHGAPSNTITVTNGVVTNIRFGS